MLVTFLSALIATLAVDIYNPRIPVVLDREYNVVSEIVIPCEAAGRVSGEVEISLDGLSAKAVKDVRLVYTGTVSHILSRTKSNIIKSSARAWGAGEYPWYASRSAMTLCKVKPKSGTVVLPFDKDLVKGENHFYVSLNIPSSKVDLAGTFSCRVSSVTLDGVKAVLKEQGPSDKRRFAIALRNHGDDGSDSYRIPGLSRTKSGELIAVYDIRWTSFFDLQADIDVGCQISKDGGRTWSKMKVAMDWGEYGGLPKDQNGCGDPCVLVDERSGNIFIFALWGHGFEGKTIIFNSKSGLDPIDVGQLSMVKSTDGGRTWSRPVSLSPQVKDPACATFFQGPGRGITMHDGTLVVPVQEWDKDKIPSAGIMYSRDGGETWKVSQMAIDHVCEDQVAEIRPGVLMLNMRNYGNDERLRKVYVTEDMGETWTEHASNNVLQEPVCQASLLMAGDLLLFANPDSKTQRNMMTVKCSEDFGNTWPNALLLDEEAGWGYSCMSMIDDQTIGILYEGSTSQLVFQAIKLSDLVGR